jgi:hypothetical protein
MGNCAGYFYTKGTTNETKELKMQKDRINQALKIACKSKTPMKLENEPELDKDETKILKIQKVFRGFGEKKRGIIEKHNF